MFDQWWLPQAISAYAAAHDAQFQRTVIASVIIFITAQTALFAVCWRYRARAGRQPRPSTPVSERWEIAWATATALLFLGLLGLGARTWAAAQFTPLPDAAETIEVLGRQFAWSFRYSGADGKFGRTNLRLVDDAANNPFGLDDQDPAARDDLISASLRIPAGRPVNLTLVSRDVVHSFFVRELRIKQDVVPGMRVPLSIRADRTGTFEIPCAELCGLGHHQMRTTVTILAPAAYEEWKRGQTR